MSSTPSAVPASNGLGRTFRYLVRTPLLAGHILFMLPLMLLTMVPLWARLPVAGRTFKQFSVELWSVALMRIFGFKVRRHGKPLRGGTMLVSNHVSWIDIELMHSQCMVGFVAKQEIRGWPVIGWLAVRGETIFHKRGSTESLGGVMEAMLERLKEDRPVAVFPEGRTRDGYELGAFHARIFQPAIEAQVPVQPVAMRYGERGEAQHVVAFGEHESFFANFIRLLGEPTRVADIFFLEPIYPDQMQGRRQIAEASRERIAAAMET